MNPLSRGNAPSGGNGWPWRILITILALLILWCVLSLTGCATTREESTHAATVVDRRFTLRGSVAVPTTRSSDGATIVIPVPVDLVLDGGGTDETTGEAKARTQIEAPELAGAVVAGLRTAFPALALLGGALPAQIGPAPATWSNMDTGAVTTAGLAIAGLLQRHAAARAAQERADAATRRADEHKADADVGWAHAMASKGQA